MITLDLARQLKTAGLRWQSNIHDFFAIPDRGMDDKLFVLTDVMSQMETLKGWPAVTFHGTSEWALDYIFKVEVIWMPTETQLRQLIEERLQSEDELILQLSRTNKGYRCEIMQDNLPYFFTASTASDAYGQALLHLLLGTK